MSDPLVIQTNSPPILIGDFVVDIQKYIGQLTTNVYYYEVLAHPQNDEKNKTISLLRIGSPEQALARELKLRENLGNHKMVSKLLAQTICETIIVANELSEQSNNQELLCDRNIEELEEPDFGQIELEQIQEVAKESASAQNIETANPPSTTVLQETANQDCDKETSKDITANNNDAIESDPGYLEEIYYPDKETDDRSASQKLMLLSELPEADKTIEALLKQNNSLESSLFIAGQICQFFKLAYQQGWCVIDIQPKLIQIDALVKFFDLTNIYPVEQVLDVGVVGKYSAPELAFDQSPINQHTSSYAVCSLLYELIHGRTYDPHQLADTEIKRIPQIYQLLSIGLYPIPEERFTLFQLLNFLIEVRKFFKHQPIHWHIASRSTLGLSTSRLENEDSYGIGQQQLSEFDSLILAAVADGMGGMAQGEVASKLAIQTLVGEPIPKEEFNNAQQRTNWLTSLFRKANEAVNKNVKDGGTTLSAVLIVGNELVLAHVGDSRIYLLSKNGMHQLSEDHSLVAIMVTSGQITKEESLSHPDRSVLTKSIGSKPMLSDGYVQDLSRLQGGISMHLEDGDILLLCSDGVWDLVTDEELAENFQKHHNLQEAIDVTIAQVIERGASDNATLVALKCQIEDFQ